MLILRRYQTLPPRSGYSLMICRAAATAAPATTAVAAVAAAVATVAASAAAFP